MAIFGEKASTTKVFIGSKTRIFELAAGQKAKLEYELAKLVEQSDMDVAPNRSARVTVTIDHYVEGTPV